MGTAAVPLTGHARDDDVLGQLLMEWGDLAFAVKADESLAPAWKKFLKTRFFVSILRSPDDDPKHYQLHHTSTSDNGRMVLAISEVRDRLDFAHGDGVVALSGAHILARLADGAAIRVMLRDKDFHISRKRVAWLRSGVDEARARIAARKQLLAAAPAAPLPVLRVERATPGTAQRTRSPMAAGRSFIKSLQWQVVGTLLGLATLTGAIIVMMSVESPPEAVTPPATAAAAQTAPVEAAPVLAGVPAAQGEPLVSFKPADNSFSVNLPGLAEEVELAPDQLGRLADMDLHQYRLQVGERAYALESAEYRERAPQDLNAAMDEVQRRIVGNDALLSSRSIAMGGATGRELRVRLGSGSERGARFVLHGKKYGMVMITVPSGPGSAGQIDTFLNSFQLNAAAPTGI